MRRIFSRLEIALVAVIAILLIVVIPMLHAHGAVSDFTLSVWGKYLCYVLLAISVDFLWGYTGLLSLGQALFFALGGYMIGMHLMLMIGKLGSFAKAGQNPNLLPDFLFFLGHTVLPDFWKPFYSFTFAMLMVLLVPGLLALVIGWLAFRARIKGVYFSILTQTLTYVFSVMFFRNGMLMGGNNGFTDFKFILSADIRSAAVQRTLFILTGVTLLLVYLLCRWLTGSRFGLIQRAVRDSETRVLFSGYPVARFKLFAFVVSGIIASLGGALYVPQTGIINPDDMKPEKSLEAVVWCAVGGRGTLVGPIIGAVGVNALKSYAVRKFPDYWYLVLGGMFIVVVVLMPGGIVGLPAQLKPVFARLRKPVEEPPTVPVAPTPQPNT